MVVNIKILIFRRYRFPGSLHPEKRLSLHVHLFIGRRVILQSSNKSSWNLKLMVISRMQKLRTRGCVLLSVPSVRLHVGAVKPGKVS